MRSQHLKRCLAMLLSLALIITAMPVQAFANTAPVEEPVVENEIQTTSDTTYTITFYADKSMTEVLQTVTVAEGDIPEPIEPAREPDEYYRYEFTGWNRPLNPAYLDESYYATWNPVEQYSILFLNWDGNEVLEKPLRVDKGTDLTQYADVPMDLTKPSDDTYDYTFTGWSPELSTNVTKNETYTAQYEATEAVVKIDVTFSVGSNGTYTVNGEPLTEKTQIQATTSERDFVLKATPNKGYEFLGWYNGSTYISGDAEYTYRATAKKATIAPKFMKEGSAKFMVGGNMYAGLQNAITAATKVDSDGVPTTDGVMTLMNDATLPAGTYRIPKGVTLLIPHDEKAEVYRAKPSYVDEDWVAPTAYRTLTLAKGAELNVDGELSVTAAHVPGSGGRGNGGSPHKAYGHIVTEDGGTIIVNKGGALYAYGYITGNGSVTALDGATVYEYFQIMDFRGGSATTDMLTTGLANGFNVLPLSQYYVQNVEVPMTIHAGATEYCYTSLKMSGQIIGAAVGFIGDGKNMMFKLASGSITKYYDGQKDRLVAEINGELGISPIEISGGGNNVNSEQFVLPINNNISIYVNSGSINMSQDVALIPGTEMYIAKGATCTLNEDCNVYVYDQDTWGKYCATGPTVTFSPLNYVPGRTYTRTEADLKDALIQVDGVLDATKGYIYTTKGGANICSTDAGLIVLRKGTEEKTYQFEYTGPPAADEKFYGIYHEIEIDPAVLQNADGTDVTQDEYEDRGIINYNYENGKWVISGHIVVIDEGYDPSCNTPGLTDSQHCNYPGCPEHTIKAEPIPPTGHTWKLVEAKKPTYTSVGWNEHFECSVCHQKQKEGEGDKPYVEEPKLESDGIVTYDEFITNLEIIEKWADEYVQKNPGKDPVDLVIKYIRTGVERYNSGSWGIMAGYEDKAFATFVAAKEDAYNAEAATSGKDLIKVSGLKDLHNFELPNGDMADFGHMFGTMDITYNNKFGVNHADVGGWAGDIVDLLCLADQYGTGNAKTVNEMAAYIKEHYFLKETEEVEKENGGEEAREGSFSIIDVRGDLDAYQLMRTLQQEEYEVGTLTDILEGYFTAGLADQQRAFNILEYRFEDKSLRTDLRDEVYSEVVSNKVVNTLEATRVFDNADLTDLRKAACYVFADYICELAGDYVEELENPYLSVFASDFSTLAPGITQKIYQARTGDGKQSDYYVATADVTRDDVHVYLNYNDNDPSKGWAMQRVLDQANAAQANYSDPNNKKYKENFNVIAAINGGGYNMSTGKPSGLLVMEGHEWMPPDSHEFFGILTDGTAIMAGKGEYEKLKAEGKVKEAIGAFGTLLVKDGKINIKASSDYYTNRASRTAIGITKTGKVVFMVMDGRQGEYSCGGSMEEIAQVMLDAGCVDAMNLDGGGSSTYVARLAGADELSVVNKPSDGVARSVSTSLFVASTAPNSKEFDHAVIESNYNYMTVNSSVKLTASGVSATNNAVELPEGTSWMVADDSYGEVTKDGVFTAKAEGEVEIKLMLKGEEVGSKTLYVVKPDNLYFTKPSVNGVYGQTVAIPLNAVYKNKDVAINAGDIDFVLSDESAGKIDGLNFAISETTLLKNVQITAKLAGSDAVSATFTVYLYNQGEASFDFEQATGGNRQFAWDRKISNAVTDDNSLYYVVDAKEKMTSAYTFAIDMSHIDIPKRLEDLTYMLPGSDMEGASAWTFLCQLAERISDQTKVTATVTFDKDVEVDYSGLTLVNDYFYLVKDETSLDKDTNTLLITLKWKKQDKPIEVALANPICILSGIKTTPKAGAEWNNRQQLEVINKGSIDYTVYMRASGLYTFSQNAENQKIYGLLPYVHPLIETEKGGYFSSNYTTFEETYFLDKAIKNGWEGAKDADGNAGMRYYEKGVMYTGIRAVAGKYYDFGKTGINYGQKVYTGEMKENGKEYYIVSGDKVNGWWRFGDNEWRYYNEKTDAREVVTVVSTPKSCIFDTKYTFTSESGAVKVTEDEDAGGHEYANETTKDAVCTVCGWHRFDMEDVDIKLGYKETTYTGKAKKPTHKAVNPLTKEELVKSGSYYDYNWSFDNNIEVGKATVKFTARQPSIFVNKQQWRGNYRGEVVKTFTILPDTATKVKANVYKTYADLSWTAAVVSETDTADNQTKYVIYQSTNGGTWKKLTTTTKTSYKVKNLKKENEYEFRIATVKAGTDGKTYTSAEYGTAAVTYKYLKADTSNVASSGKIKVTWNKIGKDKLFYVYRATSKSGKYTLVKKVKGTSYIDTASKAGKKYYYKVKGATTKAITPVVSGVGDLKRPVVSASNVASTGKIKLTWKKIDGAKKYEVYRATSKSGTYKKLATTTKTSYTNTSATAGKTYYYKVKAIAKSSSANSAYSLVVGKACDLKRPVVTAKSTTKKQVKLTWAKVSSAQKYEIYRATSKNGKYKKVATTTKTAYTNKSLTSKKTYYYKVKAIAKSSSANSAYSLVKSVKVK